MKLYKLHSLSSRIYGTSTMARHVIQQCRLASATCSTTTTSPVSNCNTNCSTVPFPTMPTKISAILHDDWNAMDERGEHMIHRMRHIPELVEFAHSRTNFFTHLVGTFGILNAWNQPVDVCRTGLVHTFYSGDIFKFYAFDPRTERGRVREIIEAPAEALVHLFGTINRSEICSFGQVVERQLDYPTPLDAPPNVYHRLQQERKPISQQTAAKIMIVTVADYLDQMVESNGWRDHHQAEVPTSLYPGDARPAIALHWMSALCHEVKDYLDVVPTAFDNCQSVIGVDDEEAARDLYWLVTMQEHTIRDDHKIDMLKQACQLNTFVGEPHVLLSQLYFRKQDYLEAAYHSRKALEKFYALATAWDKRRSFKQWIGFSRMLLYRSNRKITGEDHSLPQNDMGLHSLKEVVGAMNDDGAEEEEHDEPAANM